MSSSASICVITPLQCIDKINVKLLLLLFVVVVVVYIMKHLKTLCLSVL